MKILFLSSSFNGGGITSYAHEVADAYSKDNELSFVIGDDSVAPIKDDRIKKYYYDCNNLRICNALAIIRLINTEIRPDVIIGSNAWILPVIARFLNQNIRIITVSHSLKYLESDLAALAHRYCDYIIAGSEYNRDYMSKRFRIKNRDKVKVLYHFVKGYPDKDEIINAKRNSDVVSITFPGGCSSSKTPELIVKIVRKLVKTNLNFRFYWMGNTMVHLSRYFPFFRINNVRDLIPKDSRIVFTGKLKRAESEKLLASTNVLLSPSRREGCPMAFLEAVRAGVIAVVGDYPIFNREIVEKGGFGYVCSHKDESSFVKVLEKIILSPSAYADQYDKAYDTFRNELSYDIWKSRMDSLVYSDFSMHETRSCKVNRLRLFIDIIRLKYLNLESIIRRTLFEDIKVLISMWKLKNEE